MRLTRFRDSYVPSITSTPPQPCRCGSMKPGVRIIFDPSMCSAFEGILIVSVVPISVIEVPRMISRPGVNFFRGVRTVSASMTTGAPLLTARSQVANGGSQIAIGLGQAILGFFLCATSGAYDDSQLQVQTRGFDQTSGFV